MNAINDKMYKDQIEILYNHISKCECRLRSAHNNTTSGAISQLPSDYRGKYAKTIQQLECC